MKRMNLVDSLLAQAGILVRNGGNEIFHRFDVHAGFVYRRLGLRRRYRVEPLLNHIAKAILEGQLPFPLGGHNLLILLSCDHAGAERLEQLDRPAFLDVLQGMVEDPDLQTGVLARPLRQHMAPVEAATQRDEHVVVSDISPLHPRLLDGRHVCLSKHRISAEAGIDHILQHQLARLPPGQALGHDLLDCRCCHRPRHGAISLIGLPLPAVPVWLPVLSARWP